MPQSQSFWAPQPFNAAALVGGTSQRSAVQDQLGDPMSFAGRLLDARTELYKQSIAGDAGIRAAGIDAAGKIKAVKEAMQEEQGTNWGGVIGNLAGAAFQMFTPVPSIAPPQFRGGSSSSGGGSAFRGVSGASSFL